MDSTLWTIIVLVVLVAVVGLAVFYRNRQEKAVEVDSTNTVTSTDVDALLAEEAKPTVVDPVVVTPVVVDENNKTA